MKFDFIPETDEEKMLIERFTAAANGESHRSLSLEERVSMAEKAISNLSIGALTSARQMKDVLEFLCSEKEEDEEVQKVIDEIKAVRSEMEVFRQTILELEETKVRLRNTEYDLRQALSKISNLESKVGSLEFEFRNHREVHGKLINKHADQLDRLNKEVFDEEPEDIEP